MRNIGSGTAALLVVAVLSLSACSMTPEYRRPSVPLAERWADTATTAQQATETGAGAKTGTQSDVQTDAQSDAAAAIVPSQLGWRSFFLDRRLHMLLETALANNHDLKLAALNIQRAKAQYGISNSAQLPVISASAELQHSGTAAGSATRYSLGMGISGFELDFAGRLNSLSQAALNQYLATTEARDAAQLSIINGVAKAYFQWRIATQLQQLSQKTLTSRQETRRLVSLRLREGLSSAADLSAAQSAVAMAASVLQQQQRHAQQAENALSLLTGKSVAQLPLPPPAPLEQQFTAGELFAALPSQVLYQRPDIRQAEYGLKSANANIGAARAALFPGIRLTTSLGLVSSELDKLFQADSRQWHIAPGLTLPIFDYGRRKANVRIAETEQQILVEQYRKAILTAFRDVNNALTARKTLAAQYQSEQQMARANAQTLRLVKLQMQEGLVDGLTLLNAQRSDFSSRQQLLATQLKRLGNQVDLYTALGGGLLPADDTAAVHSHSGATQPQRATAKR